MTKYARGSAIELCGHHYYSELGSSFKNALHLKPLSHLPCFDARFER